jgi:two-component system NarL family sensor kinase
VRLLRHPVAQFLLLGTLTIVAVLVVSSRLAQEAAEDEALAESRRLNSVLARSVAGPGITRGLVDLQAGDIDRFDRRIKARLLVGDIHRVLIWDGSGRVVYSNAFDLIGATFPLDADHRTVLGRGGTGAHLSDPAAPENVAAAASPGLEEDDTGQQVRIFTRIPGAGESGPLLFEGYYTFTDIETRREEIYRSFRWITVGGPLLLLLLVTPMLWGLTRRLTLTALDRARLLGSALDASDAERRRIARDLHDGVVQDLAGTAFSVSAVAREPDVPARARARLEEAGASLRSGLKALRSLQVEIHPPDLHVEGLAAALQDLTAPAAAAGVSATVSIEGAGPASDARAALVWRVAQEAVRNALRHARAETLTVTVRGDGQRLVLEVVDDGIGFDPGDRPRDDSFGLRGLRSLAADAGGTLDVRSSHGGGTTVRLEVAAR